MPDSSISPPSSAGDRPLRGRLLPSWVVRYFSRSRASSSAPIASSAIASSNTAPGVDDAPSDGPQPHPHSSLSAAAASPSTSSSHLSGGRTSLRQRLSISSMLRRLSQVLAPSARGSPPNPGHTPSPEPASDAFQIPPPFPADDPNGTSSEPPIGLLPPPPAVEASETIASSADLPTSDAISNVSTAIIDIPPVATDDSMTQMWSEAVAEWQRKTGADLASPGSTLLTSKDAVMGYIAKMEQDEQDELANGRWKRVRNSFIPLARIFEKLCAPIGDTLLQAFPPGQIIFSTVGLIVSASVKALEELEQTAVAFDEIKTHLEVVEAVSAQAGDMLRDASVRLLIQSITVLQVIVKMKRASRLRECSCLWLKSLVDMRPLSEALSELGRLANRHHEVIAGVTYEKVTQMLSSLADEGASRIWVNQSILDLLQLVRRIHVNAFWTKEDIAAHRTVLRRLELSLYLLTNDLKQMKTFAELDKIEQWLEYSNSSSKLSKLLDDRVEGTGSWFLDGDVFAAFREGNIRSVLLSGKAGCGKSTLIAAAAQALQAYCAAFTPDHFVLVHLFDATDGSHARDMHSLLSPLLCQIARKNPESASTILKYCKTSINSGFTTKADKEHLLIRLLRAASSRVFIVIDALDESNDPDIPRFLQHLKGVENISLLASRRPMRRLVIFDVVLSLDGDNQVSSDIAKAIDTAMSVDGILGDIQDRDIVRQVLLARAEGK
ncbi:hypothetical protein GGG16DRAFT_58165 [Schizophyllum commune]